MLAIAVCCLGGCTGAQSDPETWDGVRDALARAVRELRRGGDRAAAETLEQLVARAERAAALKRAGRPSDTGLLCESVAWSSAAIVAERSLRELRARRAAQLLRIEEALRLATPAIEAARERVGRAGSSAGLASRVVRGRLLLKTARSLVEQGEQDEALALAEDALEIAADLQERWRRRMQRFSDPVQLSIWRAQAADAIDESRRRVGPVILVEKLGRSLHVFVAGQQRATFDIELGGNGLERKLRSGDRATPEGRYRVSTKKAGAATRYHLALLIDYPNVDDRRRFADAVADGSIPEGVGIGGLIEIHGHGGSGSDWTDGCIALRDQDMDLLYPIVSKGTPVTIVGTL